MRIVCLNAWVGRHPGFWDYIRTESDRADVFCFQEVTAGESGMLLERLTEELQEFGHIYAGCQHGLAREYPTTVDYGLATFVRKNHPVEFTKEMFVHGERDGFTGFMATIPRNVLSVRAGGIDFVNFHGLVDGDKRGTTIVRQQLERLVGFVSGLPGPVVLVGDFNVRPDTTTMDIVRTTGLRDLITEFGIELTRSGLYHGLALYDDTISDYVFVSQGLDVASFEVPRVEVSDHLPLVLEIRNG